MSQWTHVNGLVRFDSVGDFPNTHLNLLPKGSEGGLTTSLWVNPDECPVAKFTLSVFGDLRDFGPDDTAKLKVWLSRVYEDDANLVRQAVLEIWVEGGGHTVLVGDPDGKAIISFKKS